MDSGTGRTSPDSFSIQFSVNPNVNTSRSALMMLLANALACICLSEIIISGSATPDGQMFGRKPSKNLPSFSKLPFEKLLVHIYSSRIQLLGKWRLVYMLPERDEYSP